MVSAFVQDDDFTDPWASSDTVVLQHGFSRNGNLWRGWVPYLARHHRVLRPDLPGCGQSDDPGPDVRFTTDAFVDLTLALLDERGIERVHYVGEGIGGVIGAVLAGRHPERVVSLTAMTMPLRVDESIQENHALGHASWEDAITTLGTREWWVQARTGGNDLAGDETIDRYLADEVGRTPSHVAVALSRWATTWSYADLLPLVDAPTLLVWAEGGRFVSHEASEEITALAKNGRRWLVPGVSSQMFPFIYPDLAAPEVAKFISAHAANGVRRDDDHAIETKPHRDQPGG